MNKLKWYYNRLKLMNVEEIFSYRIPQFLQTKLLGKRQASKKYPLLQQNTLLKTPEYSKKNIQQLAIKYPFSSDFPVFNKKAAIFLISDWRKDISSGKTSPQIYYGNIERQNFEVYGDVKFVAELSRMAFLPFMAFQAVVNETPFFQQKIEQILQEWNNQNPYLYSIHWTSGIEVAIRSVNLIYTHLILQQFDILSAKTDTEIRTQLTYNYHYLSNHLSCYSSANNHLMAELMGLNVLSSYFEVPTGEAEKWRIKLEEQINKQILEDGVHMERCTQYHAEVSDQILISTLFLRAANRKVSTEIKQKLSKMFRFTEHVDYHNQQTIFGDNDEGSVIHPYFDKEFSLYKSQLASANHLFKTSYRHSGETDFRNYLLFGNNFEPQSISTLAQDHFFETAGFGFWYAHNNKAKLSFDVGAIGDSLIAAHGHSDIFHFNLSVNGIPFIVDSGTFQYHTKDTYWRNYFRGISAHNTISVNGKNHAKNNGRMSWVNRPDVWVEGYKHSENYSFCTAKTNAFKAEGVAVHTRNIQFDKSAKTICINDELVADDSEEKEAFFYLHFHPDVQLSLKEKMLTAVRAQTKIYLTNEAFTSAELVSGNQALPLGWFSEKYNEKEPTTTLKIKVRFVGKLKLETKIAY